MFSEFNGFQTFHPVPIIKRTSLFSPYFFIRISKDIRKIFISQKKQTPIAPGFLALIGNAEVSAVELTESFADVEVPRAKMLFLLYISIIRLQGFGSNRPGKNRPHRLSRKDRDIVFPPLLFCFQFYLYGPFSVTYGIGKKIIQYFQDKIFHQNDPLPAKRLESGDSCISPPKDRDSRIPRIFW